MSYYPEDRDLVTNNLKHLLKEKKITMAALSEHLQVTQQQISKYAAGINAMGINTLLETCKLLDCTPLQIYPQLDLSGNTKLMPTDTDKNVKLNQNIVVENYGFSYHVVNFFKNIVVVDFLTLNKKAVLFLIVLVALARIINYIGFLYNWFDFEEPIQRVIFLLSTSSVSVSFLIGLALPLLVQSWISYILLWFGFGGVFTQIEAWIGSFHVISSSYTRLTIWGLSLACCILYAQLIKHLRKKNLKNTGRN